MDEDDELMEVKKIKNAYFNNIDLSNQNDQDENVLYNHNKNFEDKEQKFGEIDNDIFENPNTDNRKDNSSEIKDETKINPSQNINGIELGLDTNKNSRKKLNGTKDISKQIKDGRRISVNVINRKMFYDKLKIEDKVKSKEAETLGNGFRIQLNAISEDFSD